MYLKVHSLIVVIIKSSDVFKGPQTDSCCHKVK